MRLPAKLKLIDEKDFTHEGRIDFVDNAIDTSSGTIRGRAEFPNPEGRLTPGMFGRIQIASSAPAEALLVPDAAVGTEQVRKFVYALNGDNVVNPKYVTLGPVVDGLRVVQSGLSPDDTIVTEGLMRAAGRQSGAAAGHGDRERYAKGRRSSEGSSLQLNGRVRCDSPSFLSTARSSRR